MTASCSAAVPARVAGTLALGDDALIASHRIAQWITRAPQLEEDVALANISLDLLGHARVALSRAGALEGAGRDEDDLTYLRDERAFRNVRLVEVPDADFACLIARLLLLSTYQCGLYAALPGSDDPALAALAGKAAKEVAYHRDHAEQWTLRLGDGTEESHARMTAALDAAWPYTDELFDPGTGNLGSATAGTSTAGAGGAGGLAAVGVDVAALREPWLASVTGVLTRAGLPVPQVRADVGGGRAGLHTEHLGYLLAAMQYLHRSHPGATW